MDRKNFDSLDDTQLRAALERAEELVRQAERYSSPRFGKFSNSATQYYIMKHLHKNADVSVVFYGGYDGSERNIFAALPSWTAAADTEYPVCAVRVSGKFTETLSHRDYLGALMGLGISRDTVGDIVVCEDCCFIFCLSDISKYILLNLDKIGRYGVQAELAELKDFIPPLQKTEILSIPVASLRLDVVLSAVLKLSRSSAVELISQGKAQLNYQVCEKASQIVCNGDLLSVRGFGKLQIGEVNGMSRKGRQYLEIIRFV